MIAGIFGSEEIGQTLISLENRVYSKQWRKNRKPKERRALFLSSTGKYYGRLPQGFVEVCIEILPQADSGVRELDYLLHPPQRKLYI